MSLAVLAWPHVPEWAVGTMHDSLWLGWLVEAVPARPCPGGRVTVESDTCLDCPSTPLQW